MNGTVRAFCGGSVPPQLAALERVRRRRRLLAVLLVAATTAAALFAFDPARHRVFPLCLFHAVTGLNCPGCGGTRALHHLLHGDVATALRCNALVVLALPFGALTALWWVVRSAGPGAANRRWTRWWPWGLLAAATAFGVVRNLPLGAGLSP